MCRRTSSSTTSPLRFSREIAMSCVSRVGRVGRIGLLLVLSAFVANVTAQQKITLPNKMGTVKFAVIGDTGTGDKHQLAVAKQLMDAHGTFPFDFVIMMGDNLYGGNSAK